MLTLGEFLSSGPFLVSKLAMWDEPNVMVSMFQFGLNRSHKGRWLIKTAGWWSWKSISPK